MSEKTKIDSCVRNGHTVERRWRVAGSTLVFQGIWIDGWKQPQHVLDAYLCDEPGDNESHIGLDIDRVAGLLTQGSSEYDSFQWGASTIFGCSNDNESKAQYWRDHFDTDNSTTAHDSPEEVAAGIIDAGLVVEEVRDYGRRQVMEAIKDLVGCHQELLEEEEVGE